MSRSGHPIASHLHRWVGDPTKLLASVMALPLVDGIFPAIVVAGGLATVAGVVQVGLLVFGGSATAAVILTEFDGSRMRGVRRVLAVGGPLTVVAGLEAALAPTIASALDVAVFERFAAIVVLAVAAMTVSARIADLLPRPGAIVALGFVASVRPGTADLTVAADLTLVGRAIAAGLVGTGFAVAVVAFRPTLLTWLDVDRFRFGSAVALGMLAVSLFHPAYAFAPVAVLGVTVLLSLDPGVEEAPATATTDGGEEEPTQRPPHW
ncbi:MAG: DUF5794 domain-containing protein [Halobacteriaceae archaeon]